MSTTAVPVPVPAAGAPPPVGPVRLLAAAAPDLDGHQRISGPLPWQGGPGRLIGTVRDAGLTGRGGAGFPAWRKLAAVAEGRNPVVIGNGAEGEPASAKDRTLLTVAPHLVLDGLQLAAEAVGAREAYLCLPPGPVTAAVEAALAQRATRRWDRLAVRLVPAGPGFVAGQESAVVAAVEGRPAVPRDAWRRTVEAGVRGRPTLVHNVETLAHLAQIARYGAGWFRAAGTAREPGTFLATIGGAVARPGVYEVLIGTPLSALLGLAGGASAALRAVLLGGYHGTWISMATGRHAPLCTDGLRPFGAAPGAGVVVALPSTVCGLAETARIASYLAAQNAGQCGPCRFGMPSLAEAMTRLAGGDRDPALPGRIHELADLVDGRGACHHPDGTARFVRSGMAVFDGEVRAHLHGHCTAARRQA